MKKVTVTYHAPKGDSKVVEMLGKTFFDGKAEEVELDEFQTEIITRNGLFECSKPVDVQPKAGAYEKESDKSAKEEKTEKAHESKAR